jgi:4-amino-4-deoxy-L-arabinose transferase-like glycosyltransferase
VAFFAASVPWYYALVKKAFDSTSALLALGLYVLAPLGIFASRSFMPDMASLGLSIAALLFFAQWLEAETPRSFGAAAAAAGLAVLLKLSSAVIGLPLVYMAWRRYGWGLLRRGPLWAYAAFTLAGPLAWYTHAFLVGTSHFPHDVWILGSGFALLPLDDYGGILTGALFSGVTPPVCALMLAGMWITFRDASPRYRLVFHWWLAGIVLFLFFASRRSLQHWYALPVAPVAAAFAGTALRSLARGVAKAGRPMVVVCLSTVLAGVGALSYLYASAWYTPRASPLWRAGMAVRRVTPANALVVFVDDGDPTGIYYSERKGWHFLNQGVWSGNPADSGQAIAALEALRRQGATYLVFTRRTFWWLDYYRDFGRYLDARYGRVRQTPDYIIFELGDRLWPEGGMHAGAERKSGVGR